MAWYPGATKMELQPESDAQPAIRPTQLLLHSIIAPWTARRTYEFWRDSTNLESHFGIGYAGDIAQYIGTETRADANYAANRRPDGTGAVSVETASNTSGTDPWTGEQVEELIKLGVWMHRHHGVPLRICRTHDDPGFGYHSLHPEWSPGGTACPGAARIRQFREVVFPGIVARATGTQEEDDMPTAAEIADAVVAKLTAGGGVLEASDLDRIIDRDHVPAARPPWHNKDYYEPDGVTVKNDRWRLGYALQTGVEGIRATQRAVGELAAAVDRLETTGLTDAQMARIADLVADRLAARLAE